MAKSNRKAKRKEKRDNQRSDQTAPVAVQTAATPAKKLGWFKRFRAWLNQGDHWWTYDLFDLFRRRPKTLPAEPITDERVVAVQDGDSESPPEPETRPDTEPDTTPAVPTVSFVGRLQQRLKRSDSWLTQDLGKLFNGGKLDDELLDELEMRLLTADVGVDASSRILEQLQTQAKADKLRDADAIRNCLKQQMAELLTPCEQPLPLASASPFVILVVGVNGAGKTTTIGKLARRFQDQGLNVMLAAGDTFRAAAVEQLQTWGDRNQVPVIAQHTGADSASVIYDALESAKAKGVDVLIADTAGRLHTKSNLMDELSKVKRVLSKIDPEAPHEVMLVVDGTTGQNALNQAEQFHQAVNLTGITITKLDGTAKGGVIFAIAHKLGLPIRYIGVGEQAQDLGEFNANDFIDALFGEMTT